MQLACLVRTTFPLLDSECNRIELTTKRNSIKRIALLVLSLSMISSTCCSNKRLVPNKKFMVPSALHWADENGDILEQEVEFRQENWRLICHHYRNDKWIPKNHRTLYLTYPIKLKRPMYLVFQKKLSNVQISNGDLCYYLDSNRPIQIELYSGPLNTNQSLLCDMTGLKNIAKAITRYNSKASGDDKIKKLKNNLIMFKFEEPENFTFNRVRSLIYSNLWVLKNLEVKKMRLTHSNDDIFNLREIFSKWVKNLQVNERQIILSAMRQVNPEKKQKTQKLITEWSSPVKNLIDNFSARIEGGDFDSDFQDMQNAQIGYFNAYFNKRLAKKQNLIYFLIELIFENYDFMGIHNYNVTQLVEEFFKIHMQHIKDGVFEDLFAQTKIQKLYPAIQELFKSMVKVWEHVFKKFQDLDDYTPKEKKLLSVRIVAYKKRFGVFERIMKRISFKGTPGVQSQVLKFVKSYAEEPRLQKIFKQLDMQDDFGHFQTLHFAQHLKYFGRDIQRGLLNFYLEFKLFKAANIRQKKLI